MAYHHILRQNSSFHLIKSSPTYNHFFYCFGICKSLSCHRLEFKSLQNAGKFVSTNNSKASDLTLAQNNLFRDIYRNLGGPIVFLSQKRAFEIANKIIADHRKIEKYFREEIATIEKNSKEIATIEKNSREEVATIVATIVTTIEKKFREEVAMIEKRLQAAQNDYRDLLIRFMRVRRNFNLRGAIEWVREQISKGNYEVATIVATIVTTIEKKFREEVAMIEKRLQAAQNDYRDLLIRFMRVRRNFNLRGAIEWVREQISKGNYGDYSLLSIPLAISQSSTQPMYRIKQANGYDKQEIAIDARFFASNEILALGFIFRIYNISYLYYDESGQLNNFPFKI
ncbi:hypothetical protein Glove_330g125 [Diversispora epigaea]|uniref:Uncharacterized protein n=1 Tax=Diversispora epigaea TaxID=1348612 RepID=A0A397HPU5_9GLOM|nr:hypothetical protein Glove_330g125 [Diversispora epigaea]